GERLAVATAIEASNEYRTNLVISLYKTYLRRQPKPAELSQTLTQIANGTTDEQIVNYMVSSTERFQNPKLGGNDNSNWLNQVYLDLLGRGTSNDPSAAGVLAALNQGLTTRPLIVGAILTSTEYRTRLITGVYQKYLGRGLSQGELNGWIGA